MHQNDPSVPIDAEFLAEMDGAFTGWGAAGQRIARGSFGGCRHFSANDPSATLQDFSFPGHVAQTLRQFGVPAEALCFETDQVDVLGRLNAAARFGAAVRALGCRVAIDGFGRRAATFAPLKTLRVDFIKVDGSITRRPLGANTAPKKLRAIVRVARTIKIGVIGEFVEQAVVPVRLDSLGVDYARGFGIARPAPVDDLRKTAK